MWWRCSSSACVRGSPTSAAARGVQRVAEPGSPVDLVRFARASAAPGAPVAGRERAVPRWSRTAARLAQVVGNLVDNAAEHGGGELEVTARRTPTGTRLELRNPPGPARGGGRRRGRGLGIATRAARELGGDLEVRREGDAVVASLDLPRGPAGPGAA